MSPYVWMGVALGGAFLADRYPAKRGLFLLGSAAALGAGAYTLWGPKAQAALPAPLPVVTQSPVPIGDRGLVRLGPTGGAPELGTPTDPTLEDLIVVVDGVEGNRLRVRAVGYRNLRNGVRTRTILPASGSFTVLASAVRPEDRILS